MDIRIDVDIDTSGLDWLKGLTTEDLLTDEFFRSHVGFDSFAEMVRAAGIDPDQDGLSEANHATLEEFVRQRTPYGSFAELVHKAFELRVAQAL